MSPKILISSLLLMPFLISSPSFASEIEPLEQEQAYLIENEKNSIHVFKQASPLVVSVDSTQKVHDFFSMSTQDIPAGSGSGFLWDNKGHIITNFHVIQGAQRGQNTIKVTTKDGKQHQASIVGVEPKKDIAVLKLKNYKSNSNHGFSTHIADSKKLQVGQKVLAIGNPFGFENTLTQGVVSATNRSMPSIMQNISIRNMIQTDASINPGNSGGPLINSQGQLIGMNTSIISGSGTSAGIGFAVPSNTIKNITTQIIEHGHVIQPGIGITSLDKFKTKMLARYGYKIKKGVVIESVAKGSPAHKIGLKGLEFNSRKSVTLGDIITHVDEAPVDDFDDLYNQLSEKKVGDKVKLGLIRNKRKLSKTVQLASLDSFYESPMR